MCAVATAIYRPVPVHEFYGTVGLSGTIEVVVDEQALVEEALAEVDLIHTINLNVVVGMMDLIFSTNKGD